MSTARKRKGTAALAQAFAALGDRTRLELVQKLSTGEARSISQLTASTSITRQAVTKHLVVLAEVGLVRGTKIGRENLYVLEGGRVGELSDYLEDVGRQWDDALGRLRTFVE